MIIKVGLLNIKFNKEFDDIIRYKWIFKVKWY